jgi:hypothetical protein
MKAFWSILLLFALIAAAMLWMQRSPGSPEPRLAMNDREPNVQELVERAEALETASDVGERIVPPPTRAPEEPPLDEQALIDDLLDGRAAAPSGDHEHTATPRPAENPWAAPPQPIEHSVERRDDGTIVLDGLFEVRGTGTAAAPYEVTWDLLMSAAETYQPRLGMSELPERVKMLDGKHVRISGYLMFPAAAFEAKEVLVMLNMWDGCCLGTMPSPYDAVEVELREPVAGAGRQFLNYGTIEGVLKVDPYLINDWLIGLYLMEEAKLKAEL